MGLVTWWKMRRQERQLAVRVRQLEMLRQILRAGGTTTVSANPYPTKLDMVGEIVKKYGGTADYGNQFVRRVIEVKTSFVMPTGLSLKPAPGIENAQPEMDFLSAMLDANDLNEEFALDLLQHKEIENTILVRLDMAADLSTIELRHLPWSSTRYRIVGDTPGDLRTIRQAEYLSATGRPITLPADQMVYAVFNRLPNSFDGNPSLGVVLQECEDLDKALRDWRPINHLFAKQTPYFKCKDSAEADKIYSDISTRGWKVGAAYAGTADFSLVGPSGITVELLSTEIITKVQVISGITSVSPHFLGFPDVMSNRATAESMESPVDVVSKAELGRWLGFYEDLLDKAILLRNRYLGPALRPGVVKPQIQRYSPAQMTDFAEAYMPAYEKRIITREEARDQLPGIKARDEGALAALNAADAAAREEAAMRSLGAGAI